MDQARRAVSWRRRAIALRRQWAGLAGLALGLVALRAVQTPVGAAAGAVAAGIACFGYGTALGRWLAPASSPASAAASAALGLAALLVLGTALGQLGLFSREAQLAVVAVGLACCALPARRGRGAAKAPADVASKAAADNASGAAADNSSGAQVAASSHPRPEAGHTRPETGHDRPGNGHAASAPAPWRSRALIALAVAGAALTLGFEALDLAPVLGDGANYAVELARLWQTGWLGQQGTLGGLSGQLGGQLAGAGVFALGGGPLSAGLFDAGGAAALLVLLLAETAERSPKPRPLGAGSARARGERLALFALLAVPIVFHPDIAAAPTARWSATLLSIAGFLRLRSALSSGQRDGGVILLATGMMVLRLELAPLATALVAASLLSPRELAPAVPVSGAPVAGPALPSRRAAHLMLLGWGAAVLALQAAMQPQLPAGLLSAAALLLVLPVAAVLAAGALQLAGFPPARDRRDELTAAATGAIATSLLGATGLAGSMQQAVFAAWFGLLVLALTRAFGAFGPPPPSVEEDGAAPSPSPSTTSAPSSTLLHLRGPMGLILAAAVSITVLGPNLHDGRRARMISRIGRTLGEATELRALGYQRLGDSGLHELQLRTSAGARLGFWGSHPGGLDFSRNPVRDLSWPRNARAASTFLTPLSRDLLRDVDFVIVESVKRKLSGGSDPWGATELGATGKVGATGEVDAALELVAQARSARLYRVRK
jgi:hypothetical protein